MSNHKYTKELLAPIVSSSTSMAQVCRQLGLAPATGSQSHLKRRIQFFGLDISHFKGQGWNRGGVGKRKASAEILTDGLVRRPKASQTRRAMIACGIPYACAKCGNDGHWNGEPLTLEIDHINNDWSDNRQENVQFMCPNCHGQKTTGDQSVNKYRATRSRQMVPPTPVPEARLAAQIPKICVSSIPPQGD